MSARDELYKIISHAMSNEFTDPTGHAADAVIAAGYEKISHAEFALDHKRSDMQFMDDDGELWADEDYFREYASEYGDSMQMMQRGVTEWEPLA